MVLTKIAGRLRSLILVTTLALVVLPSLYAQGSTLKVFVDQSKAIQIKNLKRVSITNPRVADVVIVSPHELIVNGLTIGRTTLYLWDDKGRKEVQIVVLEDRADIPRLIRGEVKKLLGLDTVDVRIIQMERNETLILRGVVDSDTQIEIVEEISKAYFKGTIMNLLEAKAEFVSVEDQLRQMIKLPEVKISVIYKGRRVFKRGEMPDISAIILEGFVDDQRDYERVEAIARSFGPITNLIEVVNPIQVLIEGHVLELSKSRDDRLGVEWGTAWGTTGGDGNVTFGQRNVNTVRFLENLFYSWRGDIRTLGPRIDPVDAYPWEIENLNRVDPMFAKINFDLQRGSAKVLAAPKVITRVNSRANIRVGGQIPVPGETEAGGTTIEYKTYGLEMSINPNVDHKGNITSKVDITWTTIDPARSQTIGTATFFALKERSTSNEVTVRDGQHIIISGLIQKEEGVIMSGIPILSRIPILGKLFKSESFNDSSSELVIIVTPSLLASKRMREKFSQFDAEKPKELEEEEGAVDAPITFDNVTPDQAKRLQVALNKVDSTFDKILNREELTVTAVDIPPLKILRQPSAMEVAAAGKGASTNATQNRVASPLLPKAEVKASKATAKKTSRAKDFAAMVRQRLRRGKSNNAAKTMKSVSRRAELERKIRQRVRGTESVVKAAPAEAKSLFPEESTMEPLEARLQSIITELPGSSNDNSAIEMPKLPPVNKSTRSKVISRIKSTPKVQAAASAPAAASGDIDDRVDQLFLQIKEKLADKS